MDRTDVFWFYGPNIKNFEVYDNHVIIIKQRPTLSFELAILSSLDGKVNAITSAYELTRSKSYFDVESFIFSNQLYYICEDCIGKNISILRSIDLNSMKFIHYFDFQDYRFMYDFQTKKPLHKDNIFLIKSKNKLFLFDIFTGIIVLQYKPSNLIHGGVMIMSGNKIFHRLIRDISVYDFDSGKEIFTKEEIATASGIFNSFADDERGYFSGFDCVPGYENLLCIENSNGKILWDIKDGYVYKSVAIENGILIVLKARYNCMLDFSYYEICGINCITGNIIWSKPFNIDDYKINVQNNQIMIDTYYDYTINRFFMNIETGEFEGIYSYSVDKIFSKYVFNDNKFYGLQGDTLYCYKLWDK